MDFALSNTLNPHNIQPIAQRVSGYKPRAKKPEGFLNGSGKNK